MVKTSTEALLSILEEILDMEKQAEALYGSYIQLIHDESIVRRLVRMRNDEARARAITSSLMTLIKHAEYPNVDEDFKDFTDGTAALVSCSVDKHLKVNSIILRYLVNGKGFSCIYVAISKSSSMLTKVFAAEGIDIKKVFFIDCTTADGDEGSRIIVRPDNPTDLGMAIEKLSKTVPGRKFVFFDSFSTHYLFHASNIVERFAISQVQRLRAKMIGLILMVIREDIDKKALARLTVFCDKRIDVP